VPAASTAIPEGRSKVAALPMPSMLVKAASVPARVVTTPAGVILRIRQLLASAT
jgi:hypothetical protein